MTKKLIILLSLIFSSFSFLKAQIQAGQLLCEYKENPVGIDILKPRLSWRLAADPTDRNVLQTAWQIEVCRDDASFSKPKLVWQSGKIMSDQSIHIVYDGDELISGKRYYWRVRYWDNKGRTSKWSQPAYWEMGLLKKSDWNAKWIESSDPLKKGISNPSPYFRKEFSISKKIKSARLYITSRGMYEARINGRRVGEDIFTPGWTCYVKRLQYQTYDVTAFLKHGLNAAGAILGDGWFRGKIASPWDTTVLNLKPALLLQLNIEFTDGTKQFVITDESWKSSTGPIIMSDIYNGEIYDARMEMDGWDMPGFDDINWRKVVTGDYGYDNLIAPAGVPVRKMKEIKPVKILTTPKSELVVDMGQNMVGWIRLTASLNKGDKIKLYHAEVLDKEGNFYTENLRVAEQCIEYTAKGGPSEIYEPHFTFQGFRYVKVEGFPGELTPDNLTGVVIYSDIKKTGYFECSDSMINQLQSNIEWGQRGNFVDVPTDCPQRDERLGWTGDAQVFCSTAIYNFDCSAFYTKWLKDLAAEQSSDGSVPFVIPNVLAKRSSGSTGWADAAVIVPWTMYLKYGDRRILEEQYESMKSWVRYLENLADKDLIVRKGYHFGDWLFFIHPTEWNNKPGHTDIDLISTAFFAFSTSLVEKTARILGNMEDAEYFNQLRNKIKIAFNHEFVTPSGRLSPNSQTAYILALHFGLLDQEDIPAAVNYLTGDIIKRNYHLSTGFLGTPYICQVLTKNGYPEIAYKLLLQKTYPSWLYPITRGATTIWERWDGIKPDGSFQDKSMNSFNHYAYGAIGNWMYSTITGIRENEEIPGYKKFTIEPLLNAAFSYAKAGFESMYGNIRSGWEVKDGKVELKVSVPPNSKAVIIIHTSDNGSVTEGGKPVETVFASTDISKSDKGIILTAGSGDYVFTYLK